MTQVLRVVAAIILSADQRQVLLSQRLSGQTHAGQWEFPGGKVNPDETDEQALIRELDEELGLVVNTPRFIRRFCYAYPEKTVELNFWQLTASTKTVVGQEGQQVGWFARDQLIQLPLVEADIGQARSLALPPHYAITPAAVTDEQALIQQLHRLYETDRPLLQIRLPEAPSRQARLLEYAVKQGWPVLVNRDIELARAAGSGLHLSSAQLMHLSERPVATSTLLAASVHNASELRQALALHVDFVVISPVNPTRSHPGASPLGWARFSELCYQSPVPVYALGGLSRVDLSRVRHCGGHGVAAISAYFSKS